MAMSKAPRSICVFCSASNTVPETFKTLAWQTGKRFGQENWHLVYGGGSGGLMGALADSALEHGASVTGVIPEFLVQKEAAHKNLTTLHVTQTLHERQIKMAELSDAFIILPGGLGTLAECFEILTWKMLGLHNKPIILVNHDNFWDSLLTHLDTTEQNGFLHGPKNGLFKIINKIEDAADIFRSS